MNVLDLTAKLVLDSSKYDKGLNDAETKASSFATGVGKGMLGLSTTLLTTAAAGVTAMGAGVVKLTKQATDAYGEYEQLAGGIETLFGEAAPAVMEDAANAFNDAGMSINKYMETSIQSAAALINSLEGDQAKAAELMNVSIIDMSDNVNKMGTTMEAVQNAYRGFSRGNFTMLDNLALGFSGTKQGMQELLDKAEQISGIKYDIESYSDIVQAIHVVQQEMGISGTTMEEAGKTITGSLGAVRAAWENLITGLANEDADIGDLFNKLLTSIFGEGGEGGFLSNMLPRIEQALKGITEFIKVGAQRLPEIASEMLPDLVNSFTEVLNEVVTNLASNSDEIVANLGALFETLIDNALVVLQTVITTLPMILQIAVQLILTLANGLASAIPNLVPAVVEVVVALVDIITNNLPLILEAAVSIITALIEGLLGNLPTLMLAWQDINYKIIAAVLELLPEMIAGGTEIVTALFFAMIEGIMGMLTAEYWLKSLNSIASAFTDIDWIGVGARCIDGVVGGFLSGLSKVKDAALKIVNSVKDVFTGELEIHSPSKVFKYYGEMMDEGLAEGLGESSSGGIMHGATQTIRGMFDNTYIADKFNKPQDGAYTINIWLNNEIIESVVLNALDNATLRAGGR